jgi:hypothetical protein
MLAPFSKIMLALLHLQALWSRLFLMLAWRRHEPTWQFEGAPHIFCGAQQSSMRMGMRRFTRLTNGFQQEARKTMGTLLRCTSCITTIAASTKHASHTSNGSWDY